MYSSRTKFSSRQIEIKKAKYFGLGNFIQCCDKITSSLLLSLLIASITSHSETKKLHKISIHLKYN